MTPVCAPSNSTPHMFMIFKHYFYIFNVYVNIYTHILITRWVHCALILCTYVPADCLELDKSLPYFKKESEPLLQLLWEGACRCLETTSLHLAEARNLRS